MFATIDELVLTGAIFSDHSPTIINLRWLKMRLLEQYLRVFLKQDAKEHFVNLTKVKARLQFSVVEITIKHTGLLGSLLSHSTNAIAAQN